MGMWMVYV